MSKSSLTFRELIELIESSVNSGKIKKDYPDFLKSCRDMGISSYVLNTIIRRTKDNQKTDDGTELMDCSFFISAKVKQKEGSKPKKAVPQTITKIRKRTSKTGWIFAILLMAGCVAESLFLYDAHKDKNLYRSQNRELKDKLSKISDMTNELSDDSSFSNWRSSNHKHNSESHILYRFSASNGDKLSFYYFVSSESGYDYLTVTLSGDSISSNVLIKASGETNSSRSYTFDKSGNYTLYIKYSKDGSIHKNNDNAGISNINLHRNYKILLDKIHTISHHSNN